MARDTVPFHALLRRLPASLNLSRGGVSAGGVAAVALAGAVAAIYLEPLEFTRTPAGRLLAVAIGAVGLGGLFVLTEWMLNLVRHRRILGRWLYVTYPDRPPRPGAAPPDGF